MKPKGVTDTLPLEGGEDNDQKNLVGDTIKEAKDALMIERATDYAEALYALRAAKTLAEEKGEDLRSLFIKRREWPQFVTVIVEGKAFRFWLETTDKIAKQEG